MKREKEVEPRRKSVFSLESFFFFGRELCPMSTRRQGAETLHINSCSSRSRKAKSKVALGGEKVESYVLQGMMENVL